MDSSRWWLRVIILLLVLNTSLSFSEAAAPSPSQSCPPLTEVDVVGLSTAELVTKLTAPCRYDRYQRPHPVDGGPVHVKARVHIYFLGAIEAQNLRFTAHILLMFRWRDPRLALPKGHSRASRVSLRGGEGLLLRDKVWVPHVYLSNERDSVVMGAEKKDVRMTVHPDGTVQQQLRMRVTMYCLMNLQKFPFDQQQCPLILESWTYNTSDLKLSWESHRPVSVNSELLLTEYRLIDTRTFSAEQAAQHTRALAVEPHHPRIDPPDLAGIIKNEVSSDLESSAPLSDIIIAENVTDVDEGTDYEDDLEGRDDSLQEGAYRESGNFSSLEIRFHLAREVGHYVMDYFMPSILLVGMSWVSFWLDPNAIPGRTTLGTSTMLTFITLTRNTGSALPKVSYIKATEIWFMVCTAFIFGSLLEFAFVNTIWRRKKEVALKKVNSKYILKSTMTPRMARRALSGSVGADLDRCQSWPRVDAAGKGGSTEGEGIFFRNQSSNQLTVNSLDSFHGANNNRDSCPTLSSGLDEDCHSVSIPVPGDHGGGSNQKLPPAPPPVTKMTPQEIAHWIDVRSRLWFPVAFLLFNALYWGFVWI